jgi:hypothetical protein
MNDVGAERLLDLDGDLGREEVRRPVDRRPELDASLGDLAKLREAEHLKSTGIGQDGSGPSHEAMQATELANEGVAGSEKQVVRVGEHDLGAGRAEIVRPQRLHRRVRADRHEDRRLDHAVGGRQSAGAGRAVGREQLELHWINVASP